MESKENPEVPKEIQTSEKSEPKKDKQLYWMLGVMAGMILIFLVASSVFEALRTFEYEGLTFTKDKFGEIPIFTYSYNAIITPGAVLETKPVNLVLRNDPRENSVPIDGEIDLPYGKTVYISYTPEITTCKNTILGAGTLSPFLAGNGFKVIGATTSEEESIASEIPWVTCETYPYNPIIIMELGEETKITQNDRCYTIEVASCEDVIPAVEKFIVQMLIDSRNRAGL